MKLFKISVCFGLIISVILSLARFDALCGDLRHNVLRVHIIAASDSSEDQKLKLKVRDALLNENGELFKSCKSFEEALSLASSKIFELEKTANRVIAENGFNYSAKVSVGEAYFGNREYESFTLPAGVYEAINVTIGEGKGKNWWCVMFPAVCIGAAGELSDSVTLESASVAENGNKYQFRFKTVEIYEDLKKIFTKSKK